MNIALIVEIHSGGVHTRESVEMTKVIVNEQDLNASSQDQRRRAGENQKSKSDTISSVLCVKTQKIMQYLKNRYTAIQRKKQN